MCTGSVLYGITLPSPPNQPTLPRPPPSAQLSLACFVYQADIVQRGRRHLSLSSCLVWSVHHSDSCSFRTLSIYTHIVPIALPFASFCFRFYPGIPRSHLQTGAIEIRPERNTGSSGIELFVCRELRGIRSSHRPFPSLDILERLLS